MRLVTLSRLGEWWGEDHGGVRGQGGSWQVVGVLQGCSLGAEVWNAKGLTGR